MMPNPNSLRSYWTGTLIVMGVTLAYVSLASIFFAAFPTLKLMGVLHPWTGLMLAMLLKDGRRFWPGVLLGMIVVEALVNHTSMVGIPVGIGRALGVYLGAWLILRNVRFSSTLPSLRDYLRVLVLGGAVTAFISATLRALALQFFEPQLSDNIAVQLCNWWLGDALGIALFTPLVLVFSSIQFRNLRVPQMAEALLLLGMSFLVGQVVFLGWLGDIIGKMSVGYWMFLCIAWIAVRLGKRGTVVALLMTAVQALCGAYLGQGFFVDGIVGADSINFWLYMMILSVVGMALAIYVSERRSANEKIQRLTQLYAALTHCNQAIVRCNSKEELLSEVCRVAVQFGGMKAAWVGFPDETNTLVIPVATHGIDMGFLKSIRILLDVDDPNGRGPSGTVIRDNQPFWCQDFKNDPRTAPWHGIGTHLGLGATAAVPLHRNGKPIGAISMYTEQANAFDESARDLLLRMGQDISYALENYEREAERKRNEEILHGESLASLSQRDHALREITQGVVITDEYRRATYINDAFIKQTGYFPDEIIGRSCRMLQGKDTCVETLAHMKSLLDSNIHFQGEILNYRKDGSTFWNDMSITPVFDDDGKLRQWVGVQRDITKQKMSEARIVRLSQLYAALSHCNHAIVHSENKEDLFRQVCRSAVEFGGMKMAWIGKVDESSQCVLPVASYGEGIEYLDRVKILLDANDPYGHSPTGKAVRTNEAFWCQDSLNDPVTALWRVPGEQYGIRAMAALPLRKNGIVVGNFTLYASYADAFDEEAQILLLEMAQDVSFALDNFAREGARKRAEAQRRLASKVFAQSAEGIAIADHSYNIVMINKVFTEITGFSEEDVLGQNAAGFNHEWQGIGGFKKLVEAMDSVGYWEGEFWTYRRSGESYLERFSVRRVVDEEDKSVHYIAMFADITDHRKSEERMHWLSHFDPLTGLTNRTLLEDRCRQAISIAQSSDTSLALMFLDLDHFKNVNETIGHRIGDLLLIELANRLSFIAREQDTVSRLGGDDFVLVLPDIVADGAAHIAERLMAAIAHPFQIEEHEVSISGSIGIAMFPVDGANFEELIKCADMAMYRAKQDGRNAFCFFTPEIQARSVRTLKLENGLRRALDRKQLLLHYQPQVSLDDGRIVGAEALIRWQHPEFGVVSPVEFIPIAESSGLILPIGEWVMRTAARQLREWMDMGFAPMIMSVNLSAVQFRQSRLPDLVVQILEEEGVLPQYFELELTESTAMDNPQAAIAVMDDLHQRGIRMSIDDFGTGYSSLGHLKRFKVYKLKIDRSFVSDIPNDADDKAIVRAVINLAEGLGMQTIAEGVETVEQLDFLRANGCNEMQGFYYSCPIPVEQFEVLLRSKRKA